MMSICASTRCRELESRSSWSTSPKFSEPPSVTTSTFAVTESSGRPFDASMRSSRVVAELSFSLTRQARILRLKLSMTCGSSLLIDEGTAGSCAPATTKEARSTPARQCRRHVDCAA